ncbi:MAG: glycogen synthase GlgA, partial [Nitrospinaceae bacterium]
RIGPKDIKGALYEGKLEDGTPAYLVGNDSYYLRDGLYGDSTGDYPDNAERFIFFCRSVLEACKALRFQPDIIHCNDWQTGLLPIYLKSLYADDRFFKDTRTVMTLHNLAYQGNFPASMVSAAGLPERWFTPEGMEFFGQFSFLKSGLMFSDLLSTVSPAYSREIQTGEFGCGMDGLLRKRTEDLQGILNGVDYREWDPAADLRIKKKYSAKNLDGKQDCKKALIRRFSLKADTNTPVFGMVTRLAEQKGIELVLESLTSLLEAGVAFVILGTGERRYEDQIRKLCKRHPGKFASLIGFDEDASHQIMAGSDMVLVPSQYEPCGLTQMYGLKYGTVPLVRAVGGLRDSIQEFNPRTRSGTGFKFKPFKSKYLLRACEKALLIYRRKNLWRRLMLNGMEKDYSWNRAARKYVRLYLKALKKKR